MKSVLHILFGALATTTNENTQKDPILLEVCLSPGCVADGGEATLRKCMAFAPPDKVAIKKGGCVSACGNGPVVRENERIIHKRVTDVVPLLEDLIGETISPDIVEGYESILKAEEEMSAKEFECAISSYQRGIDLAMTNFASDLEQENVDEALVSDADDNDDDDDDKLSPPPPPPSNLEWIVQAFCGLSKAKAHVKDYDGALEAAYQACEISRGCDPTCWEVVAEICQESKETQKEMEALQKIFALSPGGEELPRDVANRRRTQGFRLAKLEREASM